jgi:hypothetical protein
MTMAHVMKTLDQAENKIKEMESFRLRGGDTLTGGPAITGVYGLLPERYREDYDEAVYAVISYNTPIAWVRPDGTKVIPDVGYSDTTNQHAYTVKFAWDMPSFPVRGRELRPAGGGPRRGGIDG